MPFVLPAPQHAALFDASDVDLARLSSLLDQVEKLSLQITDAGAAVRSLVVGRRAVLDGASRPAAAASCENALIPS